MVGMSLVIASGCVFNNYIDRSIDAKMKRTMYRATVTGKISGSQALIFATILGILGFVALALGTNWLTVLVGAVGLVDYVIIYGFVKRKSVHSTLVGSISGAVPPVAGYVAVTNNFDMAAVLLFLIMAVWQMPHFYAIAINRRKDYAAAHLPVLPVKEGIVATKRQIFIYILLFVVTSSLLTVKGYTGVVYLTLMLALGLVWLKKASDGFKTTDDSRWARQVFRFSLIVLLGWCILLSCNAWLP